MSNYNISKLHPIYVALESGHYNKAIKLCLAQPGTNILAQALLAHAYLKSGQRLKCLLTLQAILSSSSSIPSMHFFPELQLEIKYSMERREVLQQAESAAAAGGGAAAAAVTEQAQSSASSSKKAGGKKGKKKVGGASTSSSLSAPGGSAGTGPLSAPGSAAAAASMMMMGADTAAAAEEELKWDWIDQFDTPPVFDVETWDKLPPPNPAMTDETLLSTLAMTIRSHLRLPLTCYQLYCWAVSSCDATHVAAAATATTPDITTTALTLLGKAFLAGFFVLIHPKYNNYNSTQQLSSTSSSTQQQAPLILPTILSNMQVLALQLARLQQHVYGMSPATAWAAQTALWQLDFDLEIKQQQLKQQQLLEQQQGQDGATATTTTTNDAKQAQRLLVLPRLAESLASKCVQEKSSAAAQNNNNNSDDEHNNDDEGDGLIVTENFLLFLKTLDRQEKWEEKLAALHHRLTTGVEVREDGGGGADTTTTTSIVPATSSSSSSNKKKTLVYPPRSTLLDLKADVLQKLGRYDEARDLIETELLKAYPDNWSYWTRHLDCSLERASSTTTTASISTEESKIDEDDNEKEKEDEQQAFELLEKKLERTTQLVDKIRAECSSLPSSCTGETGESSNSSSTTTTSNAVQKYPLRGPDLMKVELFAERLRWLMKKAKKQGRTTSSSSSVTFDKVALELKSHIMEYGNYFAPRASCTFDDLEPYLDLFLQAASPEQIKGFVDEWLIQKIQKEPSSKDPRERRKELRIYIFSIQVVYRVVIAAKQQQPPQQLDNQWMPKWVDLMRVWKEFQEFDPITDDDQRENRPADELVLLAIQQILWFDGFADSKRDRKISATKLQVAAALLESAIRYSPHNAHLKISALNVYAQLNAAMRCWELFQTMFVKHIQYESCSYLILPLLQSGGLYQETIAVCKEIIRLQRAAVQDAGEYAGRAMENGALSKADEFIRFHRNRMNRSLTTLEAKGLILDAAPLYVQSEKQGSVGAMHGIVGGASDFERAKQIISEAHDPFATFSLLRLRGNASNLVDQFSENRDLSILAQEMLTRRKIVPAKEIIADSVRRGHLHGLLIRAALVVDMTKGPKKGKLVPAGDILKKRCASLLSAIEDATSDCLAEGDGITGHGHLMKAVLTLCRTIVVVSAGLNKGSEPLQKDNLETREEYAVAILEETVRELKAGREAWLGMSELPMDQVSRLLPESIIPTFAVFQMCAEVFDQFGWGHRKRKTKRCAAGLADVAIEFSALIGEIQAISPCKLSDAFDSEYHKAVLEAGVLEPSAFEEAHGIVLKAREITVQRLDKILSELRGRLDMFDTQQE